MTLFEPAIRNEDVAQNGGTSPTCTQTIAGRRAPVLRHMIGVANQVNGTKVVLVATDRQVKISTLEKVL